MTRAVSLRLVADYFAEKGRFLSYEEYKAANDVPVSAAVLKREHGSWTRVIHRVQKFFPDILTPPVVVAPPKVEVKAKSE